jgi:2-polyprenyl-3-methyl-5-hydroxy-6-metoxy-1,4-benzoquinol methylase
MNQTTLGKKYGFEFPFKPDPLSKKALQYVDGKGRLLDIGCGEGADSVFFVGKGFSVTSIDKNKEFLKRFRNYCSDQDLSAVKIYHRSAITYRYPRNTFDVIVCLLVLCCMMYEEEPVRANARFGETLCYAWRDHHHVGTELS